MMVIILVTFFIIFIFEYGSDREHPGSRFYSDR